MFVAKVRGKKLELVDFSRPDTKLVILADRVEILDPLRLELQEKLA